MSIVYFWYRIKYRKLIKTDDFKNIVKIYIDAINKTAFSLIDDIDKNNDGVITIGETVYYLSKLNKHILKYVRCLK